MGNAFTDSQFNYAPLIQMFCRKIFYSKFEKTHYRTLKVILKVTLKAIYGTDDSYNNLLLTLPAPTPDKEKKIHKFLFSHFFVVPEKVLRRPLRPS